MTSQRGQCRNLVRAFLSWVLPVPAAPPYAVRPLHMHGATDYGEYHLGGLKMLAARSEGWCETFRGGLGRPESMRGWVARNSWPGLAAQVARGPPQRRDRRVRRGAPYVTHNVFWRTGAQNVKENVTYFEHPQNEQKLLPNRGAKYIPHSYVS